jgi:acetyltransferase-like isoleucine patch superfamily enzyme
MENDRYLPHDWFSRPLPGNVELGPRSWLYSAFAFVHYGSRRPVGVRIGHDSGLYNGTFLDLGPDGEVMVGNYCTLVGVIIATNGRVEIGDYTFIAHEVTIADHFAAVPPSARSIEGRQPLYTNIMIGTNVWIGARAVLFGNVSIGEGAIVGAAAVVTGEIPPFSLVVGNPARVVRTMKPSGPASLGTQAASS